MGLRRALALVTAGLLAGGGLTAVAGPPGAVAAGTPGGVTAAPAAVAPSDPGTFVSLPPKRILDTRSGLGARAGKVAANGMIPLTVAGQGGIPSTGVAAVALNVTAVNPTGWGFVTVYPDGQAKPPSSSNLNFVAGQTVPNLVVVKVSGGKADLAVFGSSTDLLADVAGYYLDGTPSVAGAYVPVAPTRVLDTRSRLGAPGPVQAGVPVRLAVAGDGVVPPSGASAVVLNVTATQTTGAGWATVYPGGTRKPGASNLNFVAGQTVANLVVAKLGSDGSVMLAMDGASGQLIADVAGYVVGGVATRPGALTPLSPSRVLDTRSGIGAPTGPVADGKPIALSVLGQGGVPTYGVSAVVLNVTVVNPTAAGWATVYPSGTGAPVASNLNFARGQTVPNLVVAKVGTDGKVVLQVSSASAYLLADVAGYTLDDIRVAPAAVTGVTATPATTSVALRWTDPAGPWFSGTLVRRAVGSTPPASPTDGTAVADVAAAAASVTDSGLASDTTYSYALFAHSDGPLYAPAATVTTHTARISGRGSVTGTVTDVGGSHHALAGVGVTVTSATTGSSGAATTAADGTWTVTGLLPGTDYVACFSGWTATGGSSDATGYVYACYKDRTSYGVVAVTADAATTGVDQALSPGGSLSGTVTDDSSRRLANVRVVATAYTVLGDVPAATSTAPDGSYSLKGLPTYGGYDVCFQPDASVTGGSIGAQGYGQQCYDHSLSADVGTVPVAATAGRNTPSVNGALSAGGAVTGVIREAGTGRPLAGVRVGIDLHGTEVGAATTDASGRYLVNDLAPATYELSPDGSHATGGSADAYGYVLPGSTALPQPQVRASTTTTLSDTALAAGGVLTGLISDAADHHGLVGVDVYVNGRPAVTGADGTFTLRGLEATSTVYVCADPGPEVHGGSNDVAGYLGGDCYSAAVVARGTTRADHALAVGGAVTGVVREDASGAPLTGVTVEVEPSTGGLFTTTTLDDGSYRVPSLPAGASNTVCFRTDPSVHGGDADQFGYAPRCWQDITPPATPTPVAVTTGAVVTGIDGHLPVGGAVSGTLTDASHHPLSGVQVVAYRSGLNEAQSAVTYADGTYRISSLSPATDWTVCFQADRAKGGTNDALGYAPQCWNGVPSTGTPTPVTVTSGQETTGIGGALPAAGGISGTVTDRSGHPLQGVGIEVSSTAGGGFPIVTTDAAGRYQLVGLPAGSGYSVCFSPFGPIGGVTYAQECYDNATGSTPPTPVTVTAAASTRIDASLAPAPATAGPATAGPAAATSPDIAPRPGTTRFTWHGRPVTTTPATTSATRR